MTSDIALITSSLFLWGFGEGLFFYFIPLSLQDLQASPILIGICLGGIGLFSLLTQVPSGYLSDRISPKYILWASWIIGIVATFLMAFSDSLWLFVIGLWLYYFTVFTVPPLNNLVVQVKGKLRTERAITLVSGAYNLGAAAGPFIGGRLAEKWGLSGTYKLALLFFIGSTIIILFLKQSRPFGKANEKVNTKLLTNNRFVTFLILAFLIVFSCYLPQSLTPNYLRNQALLSSASIGLLGSVANIGNAFFTLVLGALRLNVGLLVGQLSVALFCLFLSVGNSTWIYGIGYFLLGGFRLSRNMLTASIRQYAGDHELGLAFGMLETVAGLAVLTAPILAGVLYKNAPKVMYYIGLLGVFFVLLLTAFFLFLARGNKQISSGEE
jgi:predicted MFS family arabinose efflux permease